jgi:microcin C transport system substrate-binding protein
VIGSCVPYGFEMRSFLLCLCCIFAPSVALAASFTHALTLYEAPKYAATFSHFEYVNPAAPKGGNVKLAESGTFDSLNLYILKGVKAPALSMMYESLMVPSQDEPQSYYGLVAESVKIAADKKSMVFRMRPAARWHDGAPITPEDVVFSLEALKTKGDPTYALLYKDVSEAKKTGAHEVTFFFSNTENRDLYFYVAQMPILPKHFYATHEFEKTTLEPPLGSGAYKIKNVDAGRSITYERVREYWAKDLPVNRGQYNFDEIRYDMYRDENVSLEAFKAGEYDFRQEYIARNWARGYESPALAEGKFIKRKMEHAIPQGMQAFVFNVRQPQFTDRRVREAIGLAMDFEWLNKNLFFDAYSRNTSFFKSTPFEAKGVPSKDELALLAPYKKDVPEALFNAPFELPKNDGSGNARANLLKAQALLNDAGWKVRDGKRVHPETGKPLEIEFMLRQPTMERVLGAMRKNLERLGIGSRIRMVDDAQYQKRVEAFDYDMVSIWINQRVFYPGNEQMLLWHSSQADIRGSNALAGLKHPAVDAALAALINAKDIGALTVAGRALDRVLLWEWVAIPNWHSNNFRIAYWNKFGIPATPPKYAIGFQTWWMQ